MKREIKFRGKRLDNGNWVYGTLGMSATKAPYILWTDGDIVIDEPIISPESIGQYTGLKDRNGKEIYEGDILNNYDEPNPLIVKWDAGGCFFGLYNSEGDCECDFASIEIRLGVAVDAEIVGNVHTPPNLIKQTDLNA